jgi:hypothetical protein
MKQPTHPKESLLPFNDLSDEKEFENICCALCEIAFPKLLRVEGKGTKGVKQYGADVQGFNQAQDPEIVIQSKLRAERSRKVPAEDIKEWLSEFLKY